MVTFFLIASRVLSLLLAIIGTPLSILLYFVGQSPQAPIFATGALIFSLLPLTYWIAHHRQSRLLSAVSMLGLVAWLGITAWLLIHSPDGRPADPATARVQNRYIDGAWAYPRASLGNFLPELDQFLLGLKVVPALDPLFTTAQSQRLGPLTTAIYHELEADPDFHALGSVMPHAYEDLLMGRADRGHYFLYIPKDLDRKKPAPALIFLHGSGGNFKAYTWLLAKAADDLHAVLIVPTLGFGNWHEPATSKLIYAAVQDASRVIPIDRQQRHLIGLSNGGLGVCQAASTMAKAFQTLTLISPVIDFKAIDTVKFTDHWRKDHPIHIITGATDDRVPIESIHFATTRLRTNRAEVTLETIPAADHFLLFSHRQEVLQKITAWLKNPPKPPPPPSTASQEPSPTAAAPEPQTSKPEPPKEPK